VSKRRHGESRTVLQSVNTLMISARVADRARVSSGNQMSNHGDGIVLGKAGRVLPACVGIAEGRPRRVRVARADRRRRDHRRAESTRPSGTATPIKTPASVYLRPHEAGRDSYPTCQYRHRLVSGGMSPECSPCGRVIPPLRSFPRPASASSPTRCKLYRSIQLSTGARVFVDEARRPTT